jgi:hypothetical protein
MPAKRACKESLQQVRGRLSREQRLRTEKRLKELLEPEQLAVTEGKSDSDDSRSEEPDTDKQSTLAVPIQACLILIICFALISLFVFVSCFQSSFIYMLQDLIDPNLLRRFRQALYSLEGW